MFKATDIKNIGLAYLEVLERKNKEAREEMDPTDHVKKNDETGKYCVYDKDGKKVKEFDDESDANEYAKQNHDALMGKGEDDDAVKEDASNDKSDDGEGLDKVDPKAVKKKFKDRKDQDIDNDGDTDSTDKYLHKKRKAISKAIDKEEQKEATEADFSKKAMDSTTPADFASKKMKRAKEPQNETLLDKVKTMMKEKKYKK